MNYDYVCSFELVSFPNINEILSTFHLHLHYLLRTLLKMDLMMVPTVSHMVIMKFLMQATNSKQKQRTSLLGLGVAAELVRHF